MEICPKCSSLAAFDPYFGCTVCRYCYWMERESTSECVREVSMSGAGKGDDYRKVDKKKFDNNFENIFGKKDILEYHKDKEIKEESKQV